MKYLFITSLLLAQSSLYAQESIIKDFAESRKDLKLCLYPSTLRMINVNKNPAYNEMVSDVKKLLMYKLDSATSVSNDFLGWMSEYVEGGFEEHISMQGAINLTILGKDEEFVGVSWTENTVIAFYLRGQIAFQKIPELVRTFESGTVWSLIANRLS